MSRRIALTRVALFVAVLTAAVPIVGWTQDDDNEPIQVEISSASSVPLAFRSPRATMETFLNAFYVEGGSSLDQAAGCLDLSGLSPAAGRSLSLLAPVGATSTCPFGLASLVLLLGSGVIAVWVLALGAT